MLVIKILINKFKSDMKRNIKSNAEARHPLQRIGSPEEIARMVAFLLGDQSSWMTAQTITIDGGIGSIKS